MYDQTWILPHEAGSPVIDELRLLNITLYILSMVVQGQFVGYLVVQNAKVPDKLPRFMAVCFGGFLGAGVFYMLYLFFYNLPILWKIGVTCRFVGLGTFIFVFERLVFHLRRHYLTIVNAIFVGLILALPFEISYYFGLSIYLAAVELFVIFLLLRANLEGTIQRALQRGIAGGITWGAGIGITSDFMVALWAPFMSVGLLLQVAGIVVLGGAFIAIRQFDEFSWVAHVGELFVIYNTVTVFSWSLEKDVKVSEGDLRGGGLASVLLIAQELAQSDTVPEALDHRDKIFLVVAGKHILAVLVVQRDLQVLRDKLHRFVREFEHASRETFQDWDGDIDAFEAPGRALVEQVFKPKRHWGWTR